MNSFENGSEVAEDSKVAVVVAVIHDLPPEMMMGVFLFLTAKELNRLRQLSKSIN